MDGSMFLEEHIKYLAKEEERREAEDIEMVEVGRRLVDMIKANLELEIMQIYISYEYPKYITPEEGNFKDLGKVEPNKDNRSLEELIEAARGLYTDNVNTTHDLKFRYNLELNFNNYVNGGLVPKDAGVTQIKSIVLTSTNRSVIGRSYLLMSNTAESAVTFAGEDQRSRFIYLAKGINPFALFVKRNLEAAGVVGSFKHWNITFRVRFKDLDNLYDGLPYLSA